jgi:hypothetical protein
MKQEVECKSVLFLAGKQKVKTMTKKSFEPPYNVSFQTIQSHLKAYLPYSEPVTLTELRRNSAGLVEHTAKASTIGRWLTIIKVLEQSNTAKKVARRLTPTGRALAMAIDEKDREGCQIYWREIILSSEEATRWFYDYIEGQTSITEIG